MSDNSEIRELIRKHNLTREDILNFDSHLFTEDEKQKMIAALHGDSATWRRELLQAANGIRRWKRILEKSAPLGNPYPITFDMLFKKGFLNPPRDPISTVTGFSDWVFRLYKEKRDHERLLVGRRVESLIKKERLAIQAHSKWKLVYDGMCDQDAEALQISSLTVKGKPVYGIPDIVLREKGTKRYIIIEIKFSGADLWGDAWPNLRAQLWGYSKCDFFTDAEEILLVGEIWDKHNYLTRRRVYWWDSNDPTLNAQNSALFEIYSGERSSLTVT